MESNNYDSDCVITDVVESREMVLMINDEEPILKRSKLEYKKGFCIKTIPGNGYCIANCFTTHFESH